MDLYTNNAYALSEVLTKTYSTSFSAATRLFPREIQLHIYGIYGLLRIADEIVDTYRGDDSQEILENLRQEVYGALERGYSTNPIVHAFAATARLFAIDEELLEPFFYSMQIDATNQETFTQRQYDQYIHGSAEVVGLMCLKVFVAGDTTKYSDLSEGATRLGAAYQKINFLRDFAADYQELGRIYFPSVPVYPLTDDQKNRIVADIRKDLESAEMYIVRLPKQIRSAVRLSKQYYGALLDKLEKTSSLTISESRLSVSKIKKGRLYGETIISGVRDKVRKT